MSVIHAPGGPAAAPPDRHPVDEVLAPPLIAAYGLRHVLSMAARVIAVPLILRGAGLVLSGRCPPAASARWLEEPTPAVVA